MKINFIDTEISGFRAYDQVIELGVINSDKNVVFNNYISGAESIENGMPHGIDIQELSKGCHATCLELVLATNQDFLICSYGLQFDLNWIKHTAMLYDVKISSRPINGICLLEVVQRITAKKLSLDNALNHFKIPYPKQMSDFKRHRALYDANLHMALFEYLFKFHPKEISHSIRYFDTLDV